MALEEMDRAVLAGALSRPFFFLLISLFKRLHYMGVGFSG